MEREESHFLALKVRLGPRETADRDWWYQGGENREE